MNNLISFWLAPVTAFFHPAVYRDAVKKGGSRGVFYNLYLSGLVTLLVMVMSATVLVKKADQFVAWFQNEMPAMVWTPQGLSMEKDVPQPYIIKHPAYGPIMTFDMTKTAVQSADMGDCPVFVTAQKIFIRKGPGQIEERDITQAGFETSQRQQRLPSKVRITGEVIQQIYRNIKQILFWMIPFVVLVVFFIFFLFGGLFYSLIGLLFNRTRKYRLSYGAIFSLACFALTPSFILGWIIRNVPAAWFLGILINLGYLFFAFKITDQDPLKK